MAINFPADQIKRIERNVDVKRVNIAIAKWKDQKQDLYGWQPGDTDITEAQASAYLPCIVDQHLSFIKHLRQDPNLSVVTRLLHLNDLVRPGWLTSRSTSRSLSEQKVWSSIVLRRALYHGLHPHLNDRFVRNGDTLLTFAAYSDAPLFEALIRLPPRFGLNVSEYGDRGTAALFALGSDSVVGRSLDLYVDAIISCILRTSDIALRCHSGLASYGTILHACVEAHPLRWYTISESDAMIAAYERIWNVLLDRADDDNGGGVSVLSTFVRPDHTKITAAEFAVASHASAVTYHTSPPKRLFDAEKRAKLYPDAFPQALRNALQGHFLADIHPLLAEIRSFSAAVTPLPIPPLHLRH